MRYDSINTHLKFPNGFAANATLSTNKVYTQSEKTRENGFGIEVAAIQPYELPNMVFQKQINSNLCWAASASMALAHWGVNVTQDHMDQNWQDGRNEQMPTEEAINRVVRAARGTIALTKEQLNVDQFSPAMVEPLLRADNVIFADVGRHSTLIVGVNESAYKLADPARDEFVWVSSASLHGVLKFAYSVGP